jgi:putative sterol carrier protein/GNAT superfamily N-acetyltransferase
VGFLTYQFREFRDDDIASLEALLKAVFPGFKQGNMFMWKYRLNPGFANSLVVIAEKDGEVVGSNYWILSSLQLMRNLQVVAALGADIAVSPEHRGSGVGKKLLLYPRSSGTFKKNNIVVSYMFTTQELGKRLYKPAAGYIAAPRGTTTYRKLFTCDQLKEIFQEVDLAVRSSEELKKKVGEVAMTMSFKLTGVPEFSISIATDKISLNEGEPEKSEVVIEGSLPLSSFMLRGDVGAGEVIKAFLLGKVRVRKGFRNIFKMRKALKLFQVALNNKSSA